MSERATKGDEMLPESEIQKLLGSESYALWQQWLAEHAAAQPVPDSEERE